MLRMAADLRDARAQNGVGSVLLGEKRFEEASPRYKKASVQGNSEATTI